MVPAKTLVDEVEGLFGGAGLDTRGSQPGAWWGPGVVCDLVHGIQQPAVRDHWLGWECERTVATTSNAVRPGGELLQRCRLGAAEETPFACPDGCLFFEARVLSTAGWAQEGDEPMSNTAWGLAGSAAPAGQRKPAGKGGKNKKKGRKPPAELPKGPAVQR